MHGFYISISNGLLENDHQKRMGSAVWQFMWLIDKVTRVDEDGTGWVLGGRPVQLKDLANCVTEDTISRNLQRLEEEKYISITHAPYGLVVKVLKTKKRFGKNVERGSAKMPVRFGKNVEPTSIHIQDNNNKTVNQEVLKKQFWQNSLFKRYQQVYPNRDYDLCFEEMCQWYLVNKGRLPKVITAFGKWLSNTKPQTSEISKHTTAEETKQMLAKMMQ